MISYLKYLCKKRVPFLVAMTVISTAVCFIVTQSSSLYYQYRYINNDGVYVYGERTLNETPLLVFSIVMCILCMIVPVFEFSFKMNKLSCDQAYSLPIRRWQLYLSHFIMGYITVFAAFTVSYFVSVIDIALRVNYYNMPYFFAYYPLMLLAGLAMYAVAAFVFLETNSVIDGIVTLLFYMFIGLILVVDICTILEYANVANNLDVYSFTLFQPANAITTIYQYKLCGKSTDILDCPGSFWSGFAIYMALGLLAMIGLPFRALLYRSEDTAQKSESFLSYRFLIPFGAVSLALCNTETFVPFIFAVIGTYLGYALYRRSFKLDKKHWITTGVVLAVVTVISFVIGII